MKPVLHAQPCPHLLSKTRGVAHCRELAATCSETATAGFFFSLLFQTEEVRRFFPVVWSQYGVALSVLCIT